MEKELDPPAKNTRSTQKTSTLSPTRENQSRARKKLSLTPIPKDHLRTLSLDRRSTNKTTVGERLNELVLERRKATRGLPHIAQGHPKVKKIQLSKETLEKLKQFRSPTYDKNTKQSVSKLQVPKNESPQSVNSCTNTLKTDAVLDANTSLHSVVTDNSFLSCFDQPQEACSNLNAPASQEAVTQYINTLPLRTHNSESDSDSEIIISGKRMMDADKMSGVESISDGDAKEAENRTAEWEEDELQHMENDMAQTQVDLPTLPDEVTPTDKVMYEMLKMIQNRMLSMETNIYRDKRIAQKYRLRTKEVEAKAVANEKKIEETQSRVSDQMLQISQILSHQQEEINELRAKLEETDYKLAQEVISIDGILEQVQENSIQLARNFFAQIMGIFEPIDILAAYRVGEKRDGYTRSLKIRLGNPGQKGLIFKNVSNLKT